ncbi:hypothetical protein HpBHB29_04490 [Helicobacter pylori]
MEFNAYTNPTILEHARLVSVASSVGFGVSFLSWLDKETKKRGAVQAVWGERFECLPKAWRNAQTDRGD